MILPTDGTALEACRWLNSASFKLDRNALLVSDATLLAPYSAVNKFRRTIVRDWMKRAA